MVVDSPSVYNTIIGRETLDTLRAVASTYHMLLKFPTINGIEVVDGAQTVSRETYEIASIVRSQQWTIPRKYGSSSECMEFGSVDYECITGAIQLGSLDPRDEFYEQWGSPIEELDEITFGPDEPGRTFKIEKLLQVPLST